MDQTRVTGESTPGQSALLDNLRRKAHRTKWYMHNAVCFPGPKGLHSTSHPPTLTPRPPNPVILSAWWWHISNIQEPAG
eukprot:1421177-Karenia_brevis.AAC.1